MVLPVATILWSVSFQNFYKVLKTCSAGRKDFFDTLS